MTEEQQYEPWQVPAPERRKNSHLESLRMDLSRIEQQLARATHVNHIRMLTAALRDVQGKIDAANSKRFETKKANGKS